MRTLKKFLAASRKGITRKGRRPQDLTTNNGRNTPSVNTSEMEIAKGPLLMNSTVEKENSTSEHQKRKM